MNPGCRMGLKKILALCLLVFIIMLLGKPQAETIDLEDSQWKAIHNAKSVSLKAALAQPGLLAFMYIDIDHTRLATVVTEKPQKGQLPLKRLTFYRAIGKSLIPTHEYGTVNWFAHGYSTLDGTRLIT